MMRWLLLILLCSPSVARAADRAGLDWWSLQKLASPEPPAIKDSAWVKSPIDRFILAALEAKGLRPNPPADRVTLIRRATYDLHGLPPTPEEIDAFVNDKRADAYERLIDRLLTSSRYGERWGRHWLDLARFCESQGYERDKIRDHAWRYRDYVIAAFNDDKPYSDFVKEQIAGDQIASAGRNGIIATCFLVAGPWDEVGQTQQGKTMRLRVREEEMEDMISAVGQTFLGLTVNCARCHNHKFDPIPARDYYRLKAALDGVRAGDRPILTAAEAQDREAKLKTFTGDIARIDREIARIEEVARQAIRGARKPGEGKGLAAPVSRWTFEDGAKDTIAGLHGTLHGGATVSGGRLRLDGKAAFMATEPLSKELKAKTLEAWVSLANLTQRGGGVVSVETVGGQVFDAIVFGEKEPGRWMAGSDGFRRTRSVNGPAETAKADELIHVAVTYEAEGRITVYRNGDVYGTPYTPTGPDASLRTFREKTAHVVLGMRHTGGGNPFLAGEIEEARLYDRALTSQEITASFKAGVDRIPLEDVLKALTAEQRARYDDLIKQRAGKQKALAEAAPTGLAYAVNSQRPEPTFLLRRGDVEKPDEEVTAGGLSAIRTLSPEFGVKADTPEGQRRLKLAEWIASKDNPLTWRVMANRIWMHHFGRGIVGTPSDLGWSGDRPSHPELLDWLATEFQSDGGSVKKLHRTIMLSATYQQGSRFDERAAKMDADNRLLWRYSPRRLEAEAVRDAMLFVSGKLHESGGGPGFRPFTVSIFNSHFYTLTDPDEPEYNRRTVYRINVNSAKSPFLDSLDCPDPSVKTPRRAVTTTPLQALGMMNNSFVHRQAKYFAERVRKAGDVPAQVALAYRLVFGRPPTEAETTRAVGFAKEQGMETLCWVLFNASEFLYVK